MATSASSRFFTSYIVLYAVLKILDLDGLDFYRNSFIMLSVPRHIMIIMGKKKGTNYLSMSVRGSILHEAF